VSKNKLLVWDRPVRVLHWSLASSIVGAWLTRERTDAVHEYIGYAALAIVAARLLWGLVGNRHARFSRFVLRARPTLAYLRRVLDGSAPRYLGHNPLGGWMVVALLSAVALTGFTGWLTTTDLLWGYAWPVRIHEALAWSVVVLVACHVGGVVFTSWHQRENLVVPMFTGTKRDGEHADQ
jgi:cytochrome b